MTRNLEGDPESEGMMRECFEYEASLIEELEERARAGSGDLEPP